MKTLKENFFGNLGIGKKVIIDEWLNKYRIRHYKINDDLTIDVKGGVNLSGYGEKQLPDYIKFRKITDSFFINDCSNLESLEGCPKEVNGSFFCDNCPKLESLEGCPLKIECSFFCYDCGKIFTKDEVKKLCKVKKHIVV